MKIILIVVGLLVIIGGVWLYVSPNNTGENSKNFDKLTPDEHYISNVCKVGGCSGTICQGIDEPDAITTCEWKDSYACYRNAKCEIQAETGKCGWTKTPSLQACLAD